ncbi:WD-40 repeat-containing protein [Coniophora puteana RWD-64-598 SS2]|uniref:ASTRA-associated protein 1 n=1 Tax=Coniophora puteana (strain RWD-64-598) TaxID=741705 RepID=A0A5M3MYF7_CONPW|nr:WD-40 repeat-containing protein [Coniophora puteana RWD-64-598 SS2]EIW84057.1 WD-40 repeat-containing protein [Coniophora puteana RWD-64-598 SS2]
MSPTTDRGNPSKPPSPSPAHILRTHRHALTALDVSHDNARIISADASGRVVVTSTRSLRVIAAWQAHTDGVLGVQEVGGGLITHGRDNKLYVWQRVEESEAVRVGGAAVTTYDEREGAPPPPRILELDVNALNYCRFSVLPFSRTDEQAAAGPNGDTQKADPCLLAVPNLVDSSLADIWTLPSCVRLHAAIGAPDDDVAEISTDGRSADKTGIIMSMHLFRPRSQAPPEEAEISTSSAPLHLLCGYEDGGLVLRRRTAQAEAEAEEDGRQTVQGRGWEVVWRNKVHVESVMSMAVSRDGTFALSVSADHLIGRYTIVAPDSKGQKGKEKEKDAETATVHRTKHPGNASIAIRDDGRVCAVGGWDGKIRLYSTKSLKPLGSLGYHKQSAQALAFFATGSDRRGRGLGLGLGPALDDDIDSEDEGMTRAEHEERTRWVVAGGRDGRISVWALMSFDK